MGWIAERLLNVHTPIDIVVDSAADHATWIASSLFLFSFVCWSRRRVFDEGMTITKHRPIRRPNGSEKPRDVPGVCVSQRSIVQLFCRHHTTLALSVVAQFANDLFRRDEVSFRGRAMRVVAQAALAEHLDRVRRMNARKLGLLMAIEAADL